MYGARDVAFAHTRKLAKQQRIGELFQCTVVLLEDWQLTDVDRKNMLSLLA